VKKTGKTLLIFLLILVQSLMAMAAGIAMLFNVAKKEIPADIYAGDLSIGGKSYEEAARAIEADYGARFDTQALRLARNDQIYEIPFTDIDAAADGAMTIEQLRSIKGLSDIPRLINAYFGRSSAILDPVVKFSESKLRMKLLELSEEINPDPTDAAIYYKDGVIEKIPDNPGISLNVNNTTELIRKQLLTDPFGTVDLNAGGALNTINASVTMKNFDSIQVVLGDYSTSIKDGSLAGSIKSAADAINGIMLAPAKDAAGGDSFSFVGCIRSAVSEPSFDEGFSQVASTLYAALLKAGLPKDSITARIPHELAVDYIEPGLDAWIAADAGDLRFVNPYDDMVAIFAAVKGSVLTVAVAGSREDRADENEITRETVQEFDPPVYYIQNEDLDPGEQVVVDPGKEGLTVNVYRNGELISTDTYAAESSIVQIAPDSQWDQNKNK